MFLIMGKTEKGKKGHKNNQEGSIKDTEGDIVMKKRRDNRG
jgi:hypothetical protein